MRRLIKSVILSLFILSFFQCQEKLKSPFIFDNSRPLNVGIEFSPLTISTSGDTVEGLSYDILNALAESHGFSFELKPYGDMNVALKDLQEQDIDLLVSNLPITSTTREKYLYTSPIYTDRIILAQNKENGGIIRYPHELADSGVYIIGNSSTEERLKNLEEEIGSKLQLNKVDDATEEILIIKVAMGELPRAAVSRILAETYVPRFENLDISTELSFNQFRGWQLMPRDSVLRDSLNGWIEEFESTDQYKNLVKKYLKNL